MMDSADTVKGKVGEYLRESLHFLPLSYELATIKLDVELDCEVSDLVHVEPDNKALHDIYAEYEFRQWVDEVAGDSASESDQKVEKGEYEIILSKDRLGVWLSTLQETKLFAFDTETTSLDYMEAELVGVSFSAHSGKAAYVPVAHDYEGAPEQLNIDLVLKLLKPLLEDESLIKIGQNLKYDKSVLARYNIDLKGIGFDTMLESYVLNSVASRHNMDDLALKYLGHSTIHFEDIAGKGKKQVTFDKIDLDIAGEYAAEDADITLRLHEALWPKLSAEPSLRKVFEEIARVLKPNGKCCVSFSNRMFPTKSILAWRMSSNEDHFNLVSQYFKKTEKFDELKVEKLVEENGYYDPLFAVIGKKQE